MESQVSARIQRDPAAAWRPVASVELEGGGFHIMYSKGSILVVDDEINLCRILGAKLAKSGFSVVAVHDGQQAIDKVRESDFDVVLLDLILPKLDGLSALAQIRNFDRELPVIVMTACESSEALEKAKFHGVSGYINKPFDLDNLVELVRVTSAGATRRDDRPSVGNSILFTKSQPITIEVINGRTSGVFASRIEGKDERTLSVAAPVRDGCIVEVASRTPVRVGLAARDAYYSFNSYVLSLKLTGVPVLVLDKPGVIYRTQRRQSPRVNVDLSVRYGKIGDEQSRPSVLVSGHSCDLSSGGIRIVAKDKLRPGDLVYLEADGSGTVGPITAVAEVLRSRESGGDPSSVVAMRFRQVDGSLGNLKTI
jgi:CheY-like chemotaxis protein